MKTTPATTRRSFPVAVLAPALATAVLASACSQEQLQYDESTEALGQHPVFVFGIDGATWDAIDPLIESGQIPQLAKLRERALYGVLESELPSSSPVVWSTIFTGKQPPQHGVRDWTRSQSTHRRVKTVWDITSECGLATHVNNVPSSWPPEPILGHMLSGFPLSGSTLGSGTGELIDLTADPAGGLDPETGEELDAWPDSVVANLEAIRAEFERLPNDDWSDWFDGVDAEDPELRGRLRIKRMDDARVYVSPIYRSDDGLVVSYPPEWQQEVSEYLLQTYVPEGPGWSEHAEEGTVDYLYEHLAQVAEMQTRAALYSAREPWRLLIFVSTLVDRTSHPYWPYMHPDDYPELDPERVANHGDKVNSAYLETDIQLGRFLEAIPDDAYVVICSDHGFQSDLEGEKDELEGIHHEDGIYLIAGPGITAGEGPRADIEDIGPTVLHLLGLPVGSDMAGEVIPPVAEAALGHPLRVVETFETGRSYEGRETEDSSEVVVDESTWEQLRDLGYVEGARIDEE